MSPRLLTSLRLVLTGASLALVSCADDAREPRTRDSAAAAFSVDDDGALALRVGRETVRVRTRSITRGDAGAQIAAEERFTAAGDGVEGAEQTWRFAAPPAGKGDLVVRVAVDDLVFTETAACGARFRSKSTGNGICYGRATWVDAAGVRKAVPWSIDAQGIAMRVRADVLEGSTYPAVLDPVVSPELEVAELAWGPTVDHEIFRGTERGGDRLAVLWTVYAETGGDERSVGLDLLDETGASLTEAPILVDESPLIRSAAIGFDGTVFRVFSGRDDVLRMFRVTPQGEVLDPGGIIVAPGYFELQDVACRADGSCLISHVTIAQNQQLLGSQIALVSAAGALLANTATEPNYVESAFEEGPNGTRLLVRDGSEGAVATFASDLSTVTYEPVDPGAHFTLRPLVRDDGTRWVASCESGAVQVDDAFERIGGASSSGNCANAPIAEAAGVMLIDRVNEFDTVEDDGSSAGTVPIDDPLADPYFDVRFVGMGDAAVRVFYGYYGGDDSPVDWPGDVFAQTFEPTALPIGPRRVLSRGPALAVFDAVAAHPQGYAVTYRHYRDDWITPRQRLRIFDRDGVPSAGASVDVGLARADDYLRAHLAFSAGTYLVMWELPDSAGIVTLWARRIAADGAPLDAEPVLLADVNVDYEVALAPLGDDFVVLNSEVGRLLAIELPATGPLTLGTPREIPVVGSPQPIAGYLLSAAKGDETWLTYRVGSQPYLTRLGETSAPTFALDANLDIQGLACGGPGCVIFDYPTRSVRALREDGVVAPGVVVPAADSGRWAVGWDETAFVAAFDAAFAEPPGRAIWLNETTSQTLAGPIETGLGLPYGYPPPAIASLGGGRSIVVMEGGSPTLVRRDAHARLIDSELPLFVGQGGAGGASPAGTGGNGGNGSGGGSVTTVASGGGEGGDSSTSGGEGGGNGTTVTSGGGDGGAPSTVTTGGGDGGASTSAATAGGQGGDADPSTSANGSGGHGGAGDGGAAHAATTGATSAASGSPTAAASTTAGPSSISSTGPAGSFEGDSVASGDGCSCNLHGSSSSAPGFGALAIAALAVLRTRRRQSPMALGGP